MNIGDFVHVKVPHHLKSDRFSYGQLQAVEVYTDFHGSRTWYYVRWINADGLPENDWKKHAADELEVVE